MLRGSVKDCLPFVTKSILLLIHVLNAVLTDSWKDRIVLTKIAKFLTMTVFALLVWGLFSLVNLDNAFLRLAIQTAKNISLEYANLVPKDITLTFNSTAFPFLPSARPTTPTAENAHLATAATNWPTTETAPSSLFPVSSYHSTCLSSHAKPAITKVSASSATPTTTRFPWRLKWCLGANLWWVASEKSWAMGTAFNLTVTQISVCSACLGCSSIRKVNVVE